MTVSRGDILRANWTGHPTETNPDDGTSQRKFTCKAIPRLVLIQHRGAFFSQRMTYVVDGKECADVADTIAKLNARPSEAKVNASVDISAIVRWNYPR